MPDPVYHSDQSLEAITQPNTTPANFTTNVPIIKTVKVSNLSSSISDKEIKEFLSFSGNIDYVEMQRETETTQIAYVTFKESRGADTALLLSGATIGDLPVTITHADNYQLPPEALAQSSSLVSAATVKKAEDMVSSLLAKGYFLGKDAIAKAKAFDEHYQLTSNASARVASIDRKMGLSQKLTVGTAAVNEKAREMDERLQVSQKTRSAWSVAEEKTTSAGAVIMSNPYVSTGATWVSEAYIAVAKAAEEVTLMAREKVEKAEKEKSKEITAEEKEGIVKDLEETVTETHVDKSQPGEPATIPVKSTDNKQVKSD